MDMYSGECLWREDGFPVATCLRGAERMILLDQDGWLTLASAQPDSFEVHSRIQISERYCFSAPSLVGTTLYLRDRKTIRALDLG
ncbi:MAG: hypothetical protein ACI8QZ_002124 [Chlamydiales bacterium]|jgi:hypothetical protein